MKKKSQNTKVAYERVLIVGETTKKHLKVCYVTIMVTKMETAHDYAYVNKTFKKSFIKNASLFRLFIKSKSFYNPE